MIEVAVNGDECTKQDLTIEVCKFGKDLGKVIENLERERDYLLGLRVELIRHLRLL